jgi:hypothetical protein
MTRYRVRRLLGATGLAVVVAVGAAGCSGGSGASDAAKTSPAGATRIDTFDVPTSATCGNETSTTVTVNYAVSNATREKLVVDGLDVGGVDGSDGTVDVPIHCDPLPHTFVLFAYDADGHRTSQQKIVQVSG